MTEEFKRGMRRAASLLQERADNYRILAGDKFSSKVEKVTQGVKCYAFEYAKHLILQEIGDI
jgi:hypothetical protein